MIDKGKEVRKGAKKKTKKKKTRGQIRKKRILKETLSSFPVGNNHKMEANKARAITSVWLVGYDPAPFPRISLSWSPLVNLARELLTHI